MELKEILGKINKLMRLSKSNNPNEAALALEKALELINKYSVSAETLRMSEVAEYSSRAFNAKKMTDYQVNLLNSIQRMFGCACYNSINYNYSLNKWVSKPVFIGVNPNVQIASYVFDVLSKKQEKARVEYMSTLHKNLKRTTMIQRGNEYALGWAIGVSNTIRILVPEVKIEAVVKEYYERKSSNMKPSTVRETKISKKESALSSGYVTGKGVDINKPISANRRTLELS